MATPLDPKLQPRSFTRLGLVFQSERLECQQKEGCSPTLLRGKLVEYYVEAHDATRGDLADLKTFLMMKVGLVRDPLTLSQLFMSCSKNPGERILDFAADLKKLFKEAYSTEDYTSTILLQRFLTAHLASAIITREAQHTGSSY